MNVSTSLGNVMTRGTSMIWVGTIIPYFALPMKGGERDVRVVAPSNNGEFAGEDITVRSLWGGGSGG